MRGTGSKFALMILGLSFVLLGGPFLIPVTPLEGTRPPEELADPDSLFLDVDGLSIHFKRAGEGEPVLILLHGFLGSTENWLEVLGPMGEWGTALAFDRPASGLTERVLPREWLGENPYTPEAQADLIISMMDRLGIAKATLVGNSAGGTIATLAALRHPDRLVALILVDAAIYSGGGTPGWLGPILRTPQMRRLGPLVSRSVWFWGENAARSAFHDPDKLTPEIWERSNRYQRVTDWDRALWEFTLASHPLDLPARLGEIQMPVLVISGDDDQLVPLEESVRLAGEIPGAELVVIPDCGHVPQQECPEAFLAAVEAFLVALRDG